MLDKLRYRVYNGYKVTPQGKNQGGKNMFPNLNAELTRRGVKTKDFASLLKVSEKTANNKLAGRTEFTLSEVKIVAAFFPNMSIDYLFSTERTA